MGLCPWQRGLTAPSVAANCHKLRHDDYTRLLTELHPDIVVAVDIGYGTPGPYPTLVDDQGHPATNAEMRALTKSSAEALQGNGRKVLLIEPVPLPSKPSDAFDPFACLEKSKFEEQCRYVAAPIAVRVGSDVPCGRRGRRWSDPVVESRHDGVSGAPDLRSHRGWTDREVRSVASHDRVLAEPRARDQFLSRTRRLPSPLEVLRSAAREVSAGAGAPVDTLVGRGHRGRGFVHRDLQLLHQCGDGGVERSVEPYELTGAVRTDWICHALSFDRTTSHLRRRKAEFEGTKDLSSI